MASGSANRDVHLFNSIIRVYQLSYRRVHRRGGGKSQAGVCTRASSELVSANLSPGRQHCLVRLEAPGRLLH